MSISTPNSPVQVITDLIKSHDYFPNNNQYPLLIYKSVFTVNQLASTGIKNLLQQNDWGNIWINGIYDYHHYHSNTHEVLIIISGWCDVMYGGPEGQIHKVEEGDVVLHPAGVSHKRELSAENFSCVGAYPDSINYDMFYGKKSDYPEAELNIKRVGLPKTDPIFGKNGILFEYWK